MKFLVGLSVFILLFLVASLTSYFYVLDLDNKINTVSNEAQEAIHFEEIRVDFLLKYEKLDNYIETQNESDMQIYYETKSNIFQNLEKIKKLSHHTNSDNHLFNIVEIEHEINAINKIDNEIIQLVNEGKKLEAIDVKFTKLEHETDIIEILLHKSAQNEVHEFIDEVNNANEKTKQLASIILIIGIITGIVYVIVSLILFKSIFKPILKLKEASEQLSNDEFVEMEITHNDELSDLIKSFNKMACEIKQTKEDSIKKGKLETVRLMSSSLSHNLKNPLTAVKGMSDILQVTLKDKLDDANMRRFSVLDKSDVVDFGDLCIKT